MAASKREAVSNTSVHGVLNDEDVALSGRDGRQAVEQMVRLIVFLR